MDINELNDYLNNNYINSSIADVSTPLAIGEHIQAYSVNSKEEVLDYLIDNNKGTIQLHELYQFPGLEKYNLQCKTVTKVVDLPFPIKLKRLCLKAYTAIVKFFERFTK